MCGGRRKFEICVAPSRKRSGMEINMVGCLALSKAGHDKDEIYLILKEEKESVYLADGIGRTAVSPKKKNKKHIQIIKNGLHEIPVEALREKLESGRPVTDEEIKYVLKQYKTKTRKFSG